MKDERYLILCSNYKGDFGELKNHFYYSIRPMCCPIELVEEKPEIFKEVEEGYLDVILDICKENNISGILSLIDPELSLLAKNKKNFLR